MQGFPGGRPKDYLLNKFAVGQDKNNIQSKKKDKYYDESEFDISANE